MSIVALKRNSRRFLVPVSAEGFSLNGGYRNQRLIGNTNLSALTTNQANGCCSFNDPSIVKISTKNTKGYLYSTVNFPVCDNGNCDKASQANIWKNMSAEDHSQNQYIVDKVKANSAKCVTIKTDSGTNNPCISECAPIRSYHIGGKRFYITFNAKNSGEYGQGAISAGEYLSAGLLKARCLPTPKAIAKPPMPLNSACHS
jgi:hypothetical protein